VPSPGAVEFRTHGHNARSRGAIARLGATQDGVLRNHRRQSDGSLRDTVVFSIVDSEWPAVRSGLLHRLSRGS
jgi:RimJ/RimL family protein N-acetyltransferase